MMPEQQQRILGYFIEEAKDHLNTIEQGLLNLQATIQDPEMVNEVFRAAHSVKGGAAMLSLGSIQRTAHRLEDYFKVLKEAPTTQVDRELESMFLQVFDGLQALLEELQGPFGLTEDKAQEVMTDIEPVFEQLEKHLNTLVANAPAAPPPQVAATATVSASTSSRSHSASRSEDSALKLVFSSDVPGHLREMLTLFKQTDNDSSRTALQSCCEALKRIGEQFDLDQWCDITTATYQAVGNLEQTYRALAPVVIKELKRAQEQVLSGQATAIAISAELEALIPIALETEDSLDDIDSLLDDALSTTEEPDLADLFETDTHPATAAEADSLEWLDLPDTDTENELTTSTSDNLSSPFEAFSAQQDSHPSNVAPHREPAVGAAELNSLADLFEGEVAGLDSPWEEMTDGEATDKNESPDIDIPDDFSDLLDESLEADNTAHTEQDLADLFGDTTALEDDLTSQDLLDAGTQNTDVAAEGDGVFDDLFDLDGDESAEPSAVEDDQELDELLDSIPEETTDTAAASLDLSNDESLDLDLNDITAEGETADFGSLFDETDSSPAMEAEALTDAGEAAEASSDEGLGDFAAIADPWSTEEFEEEPDDSALDALDELWSETQPIETVTEIQADSVAESAEDLNDFPAFDAELSDELSSNEESSDADFGDLLATDPGEADFGNLFDDEVTAETDVSDLLEDDVKAPVDFAASLSDELNDLDADPSSETGGSEFGDLFDDASGVDLASEEATADLVDPFSEDLNDSAITTPEDTDTSEFGNLFDETSETEDDLATTNVDLDDIFAGDSDVADSSSNDFDLNQLNQPEIVDEPITFEDVSRLDDSPEGSEQDETDFDALLGLDEAPDSEETAAIDDHSDEVGTDFDLSFGDTANDADPLRFDDAAFDDNFLSEDAAPEAIGDTPDLDDEGFFGEAAIAPTESVDEESDDFFSTELAAEEAVADTSSQDFDFDLESELQPTDSAIDSPSEVESSEEAIDDFFDTPSSSTVAEDVTDTIDSSGEKSESGTDAAAEDASLPEGGLEDVFTEDAEAANLFEDDDFSEAAAELDSIALDSSDLENEDEETAIDSGLGEDPDDLLDLDLLQADTEEAEATEDGVDDSLFEDTPSDSDLELDLEDLGVVDEAIAETEANSTPASIEDSIDFAENEADSFGDLDSLLEDSPTDERTPETGAALNDVTETSDFDELDSLLSDDEMTSETTSAKATEAGDVDFGELDALLGDDLEETQSTEATSDQGATDEFSDLEKLLEEADQTLGGGSPSIRSTATGRSPRRVGGIVDQTMRVSVKHLDNLNNLVGELVVNRNSLEQDQDRLRQFLDNLLFQVQQLNDVGQRMRDLYERSLLESSLLASRQAFQSGSLTRSTDSHGGNGGGHATGATFDALEMDRFTGFHTLTQEMVELIVRVRESASDIAYTVESTDQIARQFRQVTTQLQEGLNKARMVPFAQTADRLPRAVRDISIKCGKEARLVVEGRDTLIDKMILERLYDPMTHLVNNAITHGIESPDERAAVGKPREGTITVRAFYQGNQTVIYIADDGAGINSEVVKRKAIQKGLITQAEADSMNTLETYELLFRHGFSTRDKADDFAGRGVGMDVVRTALSEIRGSITIDSDLGKGTSFTIRLPLTLSISKALSCLNNQARIAFPMDGVEDMFDVPRERIQTDENNQTFIQWRDTTLTFQPLSELLQFNRALGRGRVYGGSQDDDMISIVVLRNANTYIGIQVDRVLGEQEIVIKQIEGPVPKPMGIAGATVLGDGRVMPIADVLELIDIAQGRVRREAGSSLWSQVDLPPEEEVVDTKAEPTVLIVDDSITVRELLSMSFNKVGYRVEQARDGQEAWEKMRSGLPCDLVFCDIEMPRMDGLELLSRMQKDSVLKQIPIAMLTSRGADRHRQMAVDLGASGYFTKPYLEEALLDAAQRMLNGEVLLHHAAAEEAEE